MCYAIPGEVTGITGNLVRVDYFGQKKKARNDFYPDLKIGDYVYAQGGFVIQKVSAREAVSILETWQELFIQLQEIDLSFVQRPRTIYQIANAIRQKNLGNSCCIHGIIEFSNYCRNDCWYCGLRKSNSQLQRYRMSREEILESVEYAVKELKFKALVLQSGEDIWYTSERLKEIVREIIQSFPIFLVLSIGERELKLYQELYALGARGVLLRFELSNPYLYQKYRPNHKLEDRLNLLGKLKEIGYLIFTGFLIGLPAQTQEDIFHDIELTARLNPEMFSFGPFIPHPSTPLAEAENPSLKSVLDVIARSRISYPKARILVTTALETLDKERGARLGLLSGANSLMINLTPVKQRKNYEIYPERAGVDMEIPERISSVISLLRSLGRASTDLGIT